MDDNARMTCTVKELKQILDNFKDDQLVLIDNYEYNYDKFDYIKPVENVATATVSVTRDVAGMEVEEGYEDAILDVVLIKPY